METLSYPYKPKPWGMLLGVLFFGAIAVYAGYSAWTNDRGLIINGLIRLERGGATNFYWGMAAASAAFVAVALPAFLLGLFSSHRVTLTGEEISAPRYAFSRGVTTVKLSDIKDLSVQVVQNYSFLYIQHPGGKLTINGSFLPDKAAFERLCSAIADRTSARTRG